MALKGKREGRRQLINSIVYCFDPVQLYAQYIRESSAKWRMKDEWYILTACEEGLGSFDDDPLVSGLK